MKNQDFPNGRGGKSRWGLANFRHSPYGESGLARPHPAERMVQHGKQEDLRRVYLPPPDTQGEFADRLFVTESAVSKWERGFHLDKDTTIPTLTFAQPIQPEGWITRKGGMRPVEG